MIVYRIARNEYANDLNSSGAANRWNKSGQYVIYTSGSISLAALELLAHTNGIRPSGIFKIMSIEVNLSSNVYEVPGANLPDDWQLLSAYPITQIIGSSWYDELKYLLMKIPSAVIPSEWNYVINTKHPNFEKEVNLNPAQDFFWDHRLPDE